jgi:hypothetical protein
MADINHIASKLARVMASCRYIQRDRRNDFLKYSYASAAAVLERVSLACAEQNLATFAVSRVLSQSEKTNRSGMVETLVTVQTDVTLIDCDTGETITFAGLGSGQDVGDKAVAKAQTMALKYAWMTTLNISTGDDPEADEGVDERAVVPEAQIRSEKCPECGSGAVLYDTEEVVGRTVGIYRCSNVRCALKSFRLPVTKGRESAGAMN